MNKGLCLRMKVLDQEELMCLCRQKSKRFGFCVDSLALMFYVTFCIICYILFLYFFNGLL
jgi:hypothetical protein